MSVGVADASLSPPPAGSPGKRRIPDSQLPESGRTHVARRPSWQRRVVGLHCVCLSVFGQDREREWDAGRSEKAREAGKLTCVERASGEGPDQCGPRSSTEHGHRHGSESGECRVPSEEEKPLVLPTRGSRDVGDWFDQLPYSTLTRIQSGPLGSANRLSSNTGTCYPGYRFAPSYSPRQNLVVAVIESARLTHRSSSLD